MASPEPSGDTTLVELEIPETTMKRVTLTFDNGPVREHTDAVISVLNKFAVPATFFVVGQQLDDPECRRALERAVASGHWVANHTFTHGDPLGTSDDPQRAEAEIGRAQEAIGDLSHPDRYFRPNAGGQIGPQLLSPSAVDYLAAHEFTVVTWNNVPEDWVEPQRQWVDRALARIADQAWSLVVIHDHLVGPMLDTLPDFITRVRATGAVFVQDFPPDCVPMRRGERTDLLADITAVGRVATVSS